MNCNKQRLRAAMVTVANSMDAVKTSLVARSAVVRRGSTPLVAGLRRNAHAIVAL